MNNNRNYNLSWVQFEVNNLNKEIAFENMCRFIFKKRFVLNTEIIHSDPNHPGVEIKPVKSKTGESLISFQAKYFDSRIDYSKIKKSFEKIIEVYLGHIDKVILFCNKDITEASKSYQDIKRMMDNASIEIILLTGQSILDMIMEYPIILSVYFGIHALTVDWFAESVKINLENLGKRYNYKFNVDTDAQNQLSLFLRNDNAIIQINKKKEKIVEFLKAIHCNKEYQSIKNNLIKSIECISDVDKDSLINALRWKEYFEDQNSDVLEAVLDKEKSIRRKLESNTLNEDEKEKLYNELSIIRKFLQISTQLDLSIEEKNLIKNQVLIVAGNMGTGKTQLLANSAKESLDGGNLALLSLGQMYITDESIENQFVKCISNGSYSGSLIDILNFMEYYADLHNKYSVILIDAINESFKRVIWKNGINSLISLVSKYKRIRLVISLRNGFEKLTLSEKVISDIQSGSIAFIDHKGLESNDINGVFDFLSNYDIPVSPEYYLNREMKNPLFLTWFCENYSGKYQDLLYLIREVLEKADAEASRAAGFEEPLGFLDRFFDNYIEAMQINPSISKEHIFGFESWQLYGITHKNEYLKSLERSGVFACYIHENREIYYIGYNLLYDYIYASWIIRNRNEKESFKKYLFNKLIKVDEAQHITEYGNNSIFAMALALFSIKNKTEYLDFFDDIYDDNSRDDLINECFETFVWRNTFLSFNGFIRAVYKYKVNRNIVWNIFIENAVKENSNLNANYLHLLLSSYSLCYRDYNWTIFINNLDEQDYIISFVYYIEKGNKYLEESNQKTKLLLILLSWMLTSSNRVLRDRVSKAMIEVLKAKLHLSKELLELFKTVNDPYILQRLYGIIFGAVMKRHDASKDDFEELALWIYKNIFNQNMVYPDILLRDYARLIVERFLYEYPESRGIINRSIINPPYNSDDIPICNSDEYDTLKYRSGGIGAICSSMKFNLSVKGMGLYGDFGRYVFQSALSSFVGIHQDCIYYYALRHIFKELGYSEELFGEYDSRIWPLDRHNVKRLERIGKKYQWIAFYNILARLSDKYKVTDEFWSDKLGDLYKGAWNPFIRDFDPTLNIKLQRDKSDFPSFELSNVNNCKFLNRDAIDKEVDTWINRKDESFKEFSNRFIQKDINGAEWILLRGHFRQEARKDNNDSGYYYSKGDQVIWLGSLLYIVSNPSKSITVELLEKSNYVTGDECRSIYSLYNREFAWSPAYADDFKSNDYYRGDEIMKIRSAVINFLWEAEYDASQDSAISFNIPYGSIINDMNLYQKEIDGVFYYNDEIVAFDSRQKEKDGPGELLLRRDIFDDFLEKNGFIAFNYIRGEKQFFLGENNQKWSGWSGYYLYNNQKFKGRIKLDTTSL